MATDTQKSEYQTSEVENPKKSLTLTPKNPLNLNEESTDPSATEDEQPDPQSEPAAEGLDKEDSDTSKAKATVSPRGDSGDANDIQKKVRRAERFGVPVQLSEEEKRNSRAERFGTTNTASEASKSSEELKRKARAERFGLSVPSDEEAKKKARMARFGSEVKVDSQEEEKRKARAQRFSQPSSNAASEINKKGNIEPKAAIAGDTNGGA